MNPLPLPVVGPHVVIRKIQKKDLGPFYTLETDEDVKRYVGGPVRMPRQEWIAKMDKVRKQGGKLTPLAVAAKATGAFAGRARTYRALEIAQTCWEVEVLIAKKYWGQHFGHEAVVFLVDTAFASLCAESIIATVDPSNTPSRRLFEEHLGFRKIDTKKETGEWQDGHLVLHCLREDWMRRGKPIAC